MLKNLEVFATADDKAEIVDIQFAFSDYSYLDQVQTIISSTRRIEVIDQEMQDLDENISEFENGALNKNGENTDNDKLIKVEMLKELEQEKHEMFELIDAEKDEYAQKMAHLKHNQRAIVAYVLFKSETW